MNSILLNKALCGINCFAPIITHENELKNGQATITHTNGNHWVASIREGGKIVKFDSKPFQKGRTCGIYAALTVIAYSEGGIERVNRLWDAFSAVSEITVVKSLQTWILNQTG